MRASVLFPLITALGLTAPLRAAMPDAMLAQHMLTDVAEAYVVRVTLAPKAPAPRPDPVYGVVFAFEGSCWFYAAEYGSRILAPLDETWSKPEIVTARLKAFGLPVESLDLYPRITPPTWLMAQVRINNACVVGALSALTRVLGPSEIRDAGLVLLSYHQPQEAPTAAMFVDHCLLVYREAGRWTCIDPRNPNKSFVLDRLELGAALDPALVELSLRARYPLKAARLLTIAPSTLDKITQSTLWREAKLTLQTNE